MPLINTITSFSLHQSQFFFSLSSLALAFPPKTLGPSTAASLFHCSFHSSYHHHRRRSPYPYAAAGLVSVNRPKLMNQSGFSDYQVSVSETIRAHLGPMVFSTAMKCGGRYPDDVVLDETKVVLGNGKVVRGNSSCTRGMVFDPTLSPPPKPPPWPYEMAKLVMAPFTLYSQGRDDIDGVGDKWYGFISCCRRCCDLPFTCVYHSLQAKRDLEVWSYRFICYCTPCADIPFTYVYHSLQEICAASHASSGLYSHYKFFIDMAVRRFTEYIDDVIAKYLSVGDPESCEKLEKMLMHGLDVKLEGTEGKSHYVFKLHPLHDPSLNAYTTPDSAYKLHASAISISESSQIASPANCVARVIESLWNILLEVQDGEGELIADQLIERSETGLKTI